MKDQKHGVPALMSFFIVGLGQAVKGEWGKAIGLFIGFIFLFFLCMSFIFIKPGLGFMLFIGLGIMWIYNVYDAYNN